MRKETLRHLMTAFSSPEKDQHQTKSPPSVFSHLSLPSPSPSPSMLPSDLLAHKLIFSGTLLRCTRSLGQMWLCGSVFPPATALSEVYIFESNHMVLGIDFIYLLLAPCLPPFLQMTHVPPIAYQGMRLHPRSPHLYVQSGTCK